ncbi:unnamed protein product [Rotaria magnacalcarata]|uniref:G-protein coupled receptors family 1 profile domain-containing protein n=1 Tax=Rotaria magnacalcarata TaxID=392030 RepID=A0A816WF92_9BILA|nr:unnamed protein product [Rotaria magnacalcarata]CAF2132978.1 unnamed protein product [Rotaria magnacalcarata]CAF3770823.1 unnamed protein product [Rotaria magnacalcarata]CAF3874567.1 unnamed protein product [Rotaria magnacalcarata]
MKICIVQYTHGILISCLIVFYILPLLFSFFLHANLIYFISAKHNQYYLKAAKTSFKSPMKRNTTLSTQLTVQKKWHGQNEQFLRRKARNTTARNRHTLMSNDATIANPIGTLTSSNTINQHVGMNASSNPGTLHRSSTPRTSFVSISSPIILYANNTRANANAKRTIFLLVSLFSFYVLCWAPYNIYTWRHAYQLTIKTRHQMLSNHTLSSDFNQTIASLTYNLHADLRRFIFINYSLYLLSMISMCFSFIFYFSLNKQARHELSQIIGCLCPRIIARRNKKEKQQYRAARCLQNDVKCGKNQQQNNQILSFPRNSKQQGKATNFNAYPMILPTTPMLKRNHEKHKYLSTVL